MSGKWAEGHSEDGKEKGQSGGGNQIFLNSFEETKQFAQWIINEMRRLAYSEKDIFSVRLALEEALVNAIRHGNKNDPAKVVRVGYLISDLEVVFEIEDQGPGFNPQAIPNPLAPENIEKPNGRGVFLMRVYMSWVWFNDKGNCVKMGRKKSA